MTPIRNLHWKSIYGYLILVLIVLGMSAVFVYYEASVLYQAQNEERLVTLTQRAVRHQAWYGPWTPSTEELGDALPELEELTGATIVPYGLEGMRLATDETEQASAGEVAQGPEVRAALAGETASDRRDDASGVPTYFVAVPVYEGQEQIGVLQFAYPVPSVETALVALRNWLFAALLFSFLSIAAILAFQSHRTSVKLELLREMVQRITRGDLDARVLTLHRGEIGRLATVMNTMADKLQSQTRKRRREKDRLNTVLRTMNDGIVILNRGGKIRTMNPAAARILDVHLRKSHKRSFVQVARDHRIADVWNRCQKTNTEQSATIDLANDTSVHVVITPFLKRRARGYLVVIRDLTQLRHLQTVRQDFVSNVSHELRTPLASLRALVETLRDGALDDPPAATRFLDRMEVEVDSLTQMVQELLELSRIESGQVPLDRSPMSVDDLIVPAVERLRPQAERAGLTLELDVPEALPRVMADQDRARLIVTNLVHNAIKYTPEGSVTVRAFQDGDVVRIIVRDTGIGISPRDLDRIFERFYKADRSRAVGGTGLGLSIASHLVQAHGGEIWADSVEDEWSEFGFSLPLADAAPIDGSAESSLMQIQPEQSTSRDRPDSQNAGPNSTTESQQSIKSPS